jgi:capsular polysaccharide biosynthesis protein
LFSGPGSLQAIAYRQDILCPEERATIRPAIFLPGQIDKVEDYKATDPLAQSTKEKEIAAAISTTVTHAPTIAYHIKDAVLFDGSIYVGYFRHPIRDKSQFVSATHKAYHISTGALASSLLGTKYFGHWLADDCTKYFLAEAVGPPLSVRAPTYGHQQKYQAYFGQDWAPIDRARIDHLVVFQDFAQNSLKRKRYRILRDRIKAHFPSNVRKTYIYLRRGQTGVPRIIKNEDEIVDALVRRGFVVVDIAADPLDHIIGTLVNAKIVVSMEGGHIGHCIFTSPEDSGLLVLQPPDRFSAIHRDWSECLGIRFGFVVGRRCDVGYHFLVPEILRTIDLLLNKIES